MKSRLPALFAIFALSLAACGGGGGGGGGSIPSTPAGGNGGSAPTPVPATPTPIGATPSPKPTPTATPSPVPNQMYYPADPQSVLTSTYGKVGNAQIFDYYPSDGTNIPTAQAQTDASRYNFVWGSFNTSSDPSRTYAWRQGNSSMLVGRYYIIEEDNQLISGNNLQWFQQKHPDWILFACNSSGRMTNDYAYTLGDGFPDVPLNFENPAVQQYQVSSLITYAKSNGYTTIALDQVIFKDFMIGGNPNLGQSANSSEYACGTRNSNGSANIIYSNVQSDRDAKFTQDVLSWVSYASSQAHQNGLTVATNHTGASPTNANEQALMSVSDIMLDEAGFSNYGTGVPFAGPGLYNQTYNYMEAAQANHIAMVDIDRFDGDGPAVAPSHVEYALATYDLANEGNLDLFVIGKIGAGYGYGAEAYYQQYQAQLGRPCTKARAYSSSVFYRRFEHGLVVANAGSSSAQSFALPSNHAYTDVNNRSLSNPLSINPTDAYVFTTSGNGCQ